MFFFPAIQFDSKKKIRLLLTNLNVDASWNRSSAWSNSKTRAHVQKQSAFEFAKWIFNLSVLGKNGFYFIE